MMTKDTLDRMVELMTQWEVDNTGDKAFTVLPSAMKAEDLGKFFPPKFNAQCVSVDTGAGFVDYVNRFKTGNTMLFASVTDSGASILAVIDYLDPATPGQRGAHTVQMKTVPTTEWNTWMAANRKVMTQLEFATWLEDNTALFREPSGADLLELVLCLEGRQHVNFTSASRLDSGKNHLTFDEEISLKGVPSVKQGAVDLPTKLIAGIAPFVGASPYAVYARLKYRIQSRNLSLWFETIAPHAIIRESVQGVVAQIEEGTKLKAIPGNPAGRVA